MRQRRLYRVPALLAATILVAASCREVVYRESSPFDESVATKAGGFLGYANAEQGLTVCGQCHVSFQRRWEETAHADAWSTLASSPAMRESCGACHSTNSLGNTVSGEQGGYLSHPDPRFHDVQCESCHGPGLEHVRSPTRDNWPLATLAVGTDLTFGCGECHSGAHQPFVEQWASSRHANVPTGGRATNEACQGCHVGQQVAVQFGVRSEYREKHSTEPLPITCGVCHDPHDATNPAQLRFAIDAPSLEQNLCMRCHQRNASPPGLTATSPHSPEGPLLLGLAGWWPPNMQFAPGEVVATHGSEANPRLCAGCHVSQWETHDEQTGGFVFRSTGHTFQALPCVDANGIPTGERDCDLSQRSFRSCTTSGCHGTPAVVQARLALVRDEIGTLVEALQWMESQAPPEEFTVADRYTTAKGGRFNRQLAQSRGSEVHNPVLVKALLRASIRQMHEDYDIPLPPAFLALATASGG